ncbi:hypothetical protein BDB00DRAFT_229950 [Zychaea mexicana]|uniref:uncharacterized protein n=1 Tax=Zychaea mexicana TaxID=64656 RepID=UPI0022FE25FE|nr:uncharacterized protein BDB00DRAFT_229950 [Zychaea mexicana]KAI9499335.1 hypothetical protein BDB00DRAFT_229950 [Zychaea mexicana]
MTPSAPRNIPTATPPGACAPAPPPPNSGRRIFSPSITSMKEMFDVSYAVQRIAEEKPRRKKNLSSTDNARAKFVKARNADDEEDTNNEDMLHQRLRQQNMNKADLQQQNGGEQTLQEEEMEEVRARLDKALAIETAAHNWHHRLHKKKPTNYWQKQHSRKGPINCLS